MRADAGADAGADAVVEHGAIQRAVMQSGTGEARARTWGIAVEVPVQLLVDGAPWVVQMATPSDLEDLAIGLALTEGLVAHSSELAHVASTSWLGEHAVAIVRTSNAAAPEARTLTVGTACGLCGIESLVVLQERQAKRRASVGARAAASRAIVTDAAILRAAATLPALQPLNAVTRSVHAAAWCALDGEVVVVREDVGRHNALDKLIGALARAERLDEPGFILMSSRCSYELVAKATFTGAHLIASASAPTSMALTWSQALGIPVATIGRDDGQPVVVRFPEESLNV